MARRARLFALGFTVIRIDYRDPTPWIDTGEGPNKCYVVGRDLAQTHPCKPEETRGARR